MKFSLLDKPGFYNMAAYHIVGKLEGANRIFKFGIKKIIKVDNGAATPRYEFVVIETKMLGYTKDTTMKHSSVIPEDITTMALYPFKQLSWRHGKIRNNLTLNKTGGYDHVVYYGAKPINMSKTQAISGLEWRLMMNDIKRIIQGRKNEFS